MGWRAARTPRPVLDGGHAKCPPFDPVFPPFQQDRTSSSSTARSADRAVLYELKRFVVRIHVILETPDKREVGWFESRPVPRPELREPLLASASGVHRITTSNAPGGRPAMGASYSPP